MDSILEHARDADLTRALWFPHLQCRIFHLKAVVAYIFAQRLI